MNLENYIIDNVSMVSVSKMIFNDSLDCISSSISLPVLIYRYSESTCNSCVNQELYLIEKYVGVNNVFILPAYLDTRDNEIKLKNELHKFRYKNIPIDDLYIPSMYNIPLRYFAILDTTKKITMHYFPKREMIGLTEKYLMFVNEILENGK